MKCIERIFMLFLFAAILICGSCSSKTDVKNVQEQDLLVSGGAEEDVLVADPAKEPPVVDETGKLEKILCSDPDPRVVSADEEEVCLNHYRWWKIDNYGEWKKHPDACENNKCTKYVDGNASAEGATGSEQQPYRSIQAAFDVSGPGDVICVKPGIYHEHYWEENAGPTSLYYKNNDYSGLVINKGGEKGASVVIAAIGEGRVVLDGENEHDTGIFINAIGNDQALMQFNDAVKFVEIYGLEIKNYKLYGIDSKGSCIRIGNNDIHDVARAIPDPDYYDYKGFSEYNYLVRDKIDNDRDGLVDEFDEWHERPSIGRDGISDEYFTVGNMFIENKVHDNGFWYQHDCQRTDEGLQGTQWDKIYCLNVPLDHAPPGTDPQKAADVALGNMWVQGTALYLRGNHMIVRGNELYNNAASGMNLGYHAQDNIIDGNKVYQNGIKGIYMAASENVEITNNVAYENGQYLKPPNVALNDGLYLVPPTIIAGIYSSIPRNIRIVDNHFFDNGYYEVLIQYGREYANLEAMCSDCDPTNTASRLSSCLRLNCATITDAVKRQECEAEVTACGRFKPGCVSKCSKIGCLGGDSYVQGNVIERTNGLAPRVGTGECLYLFEGQINN